MQLVVVLGTGTEIGKTFATVSLARALAALQPNAPVLALKPVETGIALGPGGTPPPQSDAAALEAVCHRVAPPRPHPMCALRTPVSPFRAAALEHRGVSISEIRKQVADITLRYTTGWCLIETAGGALSPLTRDDTNADLALALGPDALWVLVGPDSLGVIHDVTATCAALRTRGRAPDLLVLSAARPPDESSGGNAAELRDIGFPLPIYTLERGGDAGAAALAAAVVAASPGA